MVQYYGNFSIKQYIRNKPIHFGYKVWFLYGADGYPYNVDLYKDKDEGRKEPLGTSLVKRMSSTIEHGKCKKHILHFDNFFTNYSLLVDFAARNCRAIGKVRSNLKESCSFGVAKKDERASHDYKSDEIVLFIQWKDNSIFTIGTNFSRVERLKVDRWVKGKGNISVGQLKVKFECNKSMGAVVPLDMLLGSYRPNLNSKKC